MLIRASIFQSATTLSYSFNNLSELSLALTLNVQKLEKLQWVVNLLIQRDKIK